MLPTTAAEDRVSSEATEWSPFGFDAAILERYTAVAVLADKREVGSLPLNQRDRCPAAVK